MKGQLHGNAKISKEAKEIVQECVSEFISFVASEASDRCAGEKRKTINGADIVAAMEALGFDRYIEPLRAFLDKYREKLKIEPDGRRDAKRAKREAAEDALAAPTAPAAAAAVDASSGLFGSNFGSDSPPPTPAAPPAAPSG